MNVEVGLTVAAHPLADHQRLREVHEVEKEASEVEAAEAEDKGQAAEIASGVLHEGLEVGGKCTRDAMALDAVSALGFFALLRGEALGRAVGRVDGGGFNAEAQGAK